MGKITGTNSKSDEIPHPNYHVEAYGCSSPLTFSTKETEKLQRMGEKQTTLPELGLTTQKQMFVWRRKRRRWNNEEGGLKKKMVLACWLVLWFVRRRIEFEWKKMGSEERWEMTVRKKRRAGIASCLSFCSVLFIVHQNVTLSFFSFSFYFLPLHDLIKL